MTMTTIDENSNESRLGEPSLGSSQIVGRLLRSRLGDAADLADSLHRHRTATATPETGTVLA